MSVDDYENLTDEEHEALGAMRHRGLVEGKMSAEDHRKKELQIAHELAAQLQKRIERLTHENDILRGKLADSDEDCIHCGLSTAEWNRCEHGFPGCARCDDLMVYESMKDKKDG